MRLKNSLKNMIASLSSNFLSIIIGLVAQALFIRFLGNEYLGLNSLFSNIISMLGIIELGIGSAIIYNLYKPIVDNDITKIKSLMKFYKKSYNFILLGVLIIGLILIPFLRYIVDFDSVTVNINIISVYLLFLLDISVSYVLSYKRSLLFANQKNYIINIIHMLYYLVMNTTQIIILYFTRSYYLYLIIKIICRLIENIVITLIVNKMYHFIKEKNTEQLDKDTEQDIFQKIKALFFHKIGTFIILGTDNIIIAKFINIVTVGLYSNYFLIINAVQTVINQIITATTASVGNLLVTETQEHQYSVFKRIRFINFWVATFSCISIYFIIDSFITVWIGKEYILCETVLIVLVINLFQKLMRSSYTAFKEAAGIYYQDRFIPLIESTVNIIASIILVKICGLAGVFIGTILSGLVLWTYSYPKYVYCPLFNRKYKDYYLETLGYLLLFGLFLVLFYYLNNNLNISNNYLNLIIRMIISLGLTNILLLLIFIKNNNYIYFKDLIINKFNKYFKIILKILFMVCLIATIITSSFLLYCIVKLSVLPTKYLMIIITIVVVISLLSLILLLMKKRVLVIIGIILMLINITISAGAIYYLNVTNKFLDNSFNTELISYTNNFYVVSLNNPKYNDKKINKVGYYIDTPNINELKSKYNKYQYTEYITLNSLFDDLGTKINYLIIEKATYDLFFQTMSDYNIYNYQIVKELDLEVNEPVIKKESIATNNNNINIYIGGTDFTETYYDFNMILTINPDTHKILLTSIPRDYYINVAGKGKKDILGYHGVYGINTSIASIENMLNIHIDYYIKITTNSLVNIVDTLGGLEYCSSNEFTTTHALVLNTYNDNGTRLFVKEGCGYYDGLELLTIARERKAFPGGDRDRQKNCQKIVISLFNKMASPNNLLKYSDILNALSDFYITNIPRGLVTDTVKDMIDHGNQWQFTRQSLNGYDSNNYVHLSSIKDYVMVPYQNSINSCKINIKSL